MVNCPSCCAENADGDALCCECGASLERGYPPTVTAATPDRYSNQDAPTPAYAPFHHARFASGSRLGRRYRIAALLGKGGMGEVYRANDLELDQIVALKFLPERFASDSQARAGLISEIRTARKITHANVCRIHDLGEADGHFFLTMEYVEGENLSQFIRRGGPGTEEEALEIARQICLGMAAAHDAGVVHRDLKPANIMIDSRGRVRVMDFGLAALQKDLVGQSSVCGTPRYMAPELFNEGAPSVRSDIYALGLILYEIYTGRQAFDARQLPVLRKLHQSATPRLPSTYVADMDSPVERLIMRCLEKDPKERPVSVAAVLAALPGGGPSAAADIESSQSPRYDERKLVTVMCGSLMADAEMMDPELERDAIDRFSEKLVPLVEQYEGTIEKSVGDEIVVVFGDPVSHEDDAERALRVALEMMAAVARFNSESREELGLRLGVNSGVVILAGRESRGRQKSPVTGDAVNLAARLEESADLGDILVGTATHRLTASSFEFEAGDPIRVKGKRDPVAVYRLLGKSGFREVRGRGTVSSSLVGREGECRALHAAIEHLQAGVGGVVTLVGDAGLGKSRLVAELRDRTLQQVPSIPQGRAVVSQRKAPQWVEARCLSFGGSVAYLVWLDALRGLLRIQAEDPPLEARDALRERVDALCPDYSDEVFPHLARLMSLPLGGETDATLRGLGGQGLKAGAFRAIETLIESAARSRGPLVLVCEDLHWADPTSLELLEQLLSLTDRVPVLFICLFRPETHHGCWRIKETAGRQFRHRHTDLWLQPLSAAESEQLVDSLLRVDELPAGLGQQILEHAEGNPFYVEEIIRSLIADGAIVRDDNDGHGKSVRTVGDIAIPDTLSGVLMARIDRLEAETKRILQLAAVIGRAFYYRVLEVIAHKGHELDCDLSTLQREEMIRERARIPELEYIFQHQLTQAAAYESLLKKERRTFHRQVAEVLERLFSDRIEEHLELLAYHWERAEQPEKAIDYLCRAGQKAADGYANIEALEHFQRALGLAEDTDGYDSILARRAKVRLDMFEGREAAGDYQQLLDRARETADPVRELESLLGLAAASYTTALDEPAFASTSRQHYDEAYRLASQLNHKAGMVRALIATAWFTDYWPAYWDQAVANVEEAWTISQQTGDEDLILDCMIAKANKDLLSIGEVEDLLSRLESRRDLPRLKEASFRLTWRHLFAGNFVRCVEVCESSTSLAIKLGAPPVMYATIKSLALLGLGRYDTAWESLQQEIADEDYPLGKCLKAFGEGLRFMELMAFETATQILRSVVAEARHVGRAWLQLWAEAELSLSLLRCQRADEINLDWIHQDLARTSTTLLAAAPQLLGEIALYKEDFDEALRHAEKAHCEADLYGWKSATLAALELKLRILLAQERHADVVSLADTALTLATEMEQLPLEWRVHLAKAQALQVLEDPETAALEYRASTEIIWELADTIDDTHLKRGFLANPLVATALDVG